MLKNFADVVRRTLRKIDLFGRLGGEEFAILLPETSTDAARQFAERLRENVATSLVDIDNNTIRVTVSIGCADLTNDDDNSDIALARADAALYRAKAAGRDRVITAE